MSRNKLFQSLTAALALTLALSALAASQNKKSDSKALVKASFQLADAETLGNTSLKAGTYQVTADESKVSFWQNKKLMAEAPITWKQLDQSPLRNTLVVDSGKIVEVRFPRKNRSAVVE